MARKKWQQSGALIAAGADINSPPVITYLCEGQMPFRDFESRLEVLKMLVHHGAQLNPLTGLTPQEALLESFQKEAQAEIQFRAMATVLARAGARWNLSGHENRARQHTRILTER